MTDGYFSFADQSVELYPLQSITNDPTPVLKIADPVMYAIATFFSELLQTNLLPRFANEAAACKLTHANLDNFVDGYAVAQTIVFPLNEQLLKANEFRFPLLAIQPESEEYANWTLTNLATKRSFRVAWILPPLTAFQYNRMYPFFGLASKVLFSYGNQGYDPKVNPQGPSFWQTVGVSFGFMDGVTYEPYEGTSAKGDKAYFPCIEMGMSFVERNQQPVRDNFESFTEVSTLQINLNDGYNPANPIVDFIDGYVPPNITLTSCGPATGTIQGGTMVTIKGTGFDPNKGLSLTLDGSPAAKMVVQSPTIILAVTNPGPGVTGTIGPVVITDAQNNQYSLPSGFAYSTP